MLFHSQALILSVRYILASHLLLFQLLIAESSLTASYIYSQGIMA